MRRGADKAITDAIDALAQDVAIEKILAALAATRDGLGNPPATP
jgi:hypothetical protein